ncbi:DUF6802 family protein [Gordonia sp. (in: high G+C Gram-positive bacteria)]|uniref:DUF6802 family protein n=1 Tax=Gordonia sp. (in: high G+C Gram-positive bacteria) TaxID=84139 RepID=UPI0016A27E8C|nr:DUF6802 family protein [Gordonia sp. (in: high G+C Gram-positive bacteria)]NLG48310.1 hypothetical protein [Gordonia sp. (in: high G+C Gram-positive bacteria)]
MDDLVPDPGWESEDHLIARPDEVGGRPPWSVTDDIVEVGGADPHDHLWWYADGTVWDLGPADLDSDGDGRPDALTSELNGSTAILADADGDGRVDRMSVLDSDGRVAAWGVDGSGEEWSPTRVGRLD